MTNDLVPRGSIVVGVDGSPGGDAAIDWAAAEAQRRHRPLHLVHVYSHEYPLSTFGAPPDEDARNAQAVALLEKAVARAKAAGPGLDVTTTVHPDVPAGALVAASRRADSVVVGTRALGGVRSAILGSVSLQVAMHADCPVVVVRARPEAEVAPGPSEGRVVVGIDGSEGSEAALGYAFAEASSRRCGLTVVHAWWLEFVESALVTAPMTSDWSDIAQSQQLMVSESMAGWGEKFPDVEVRQHVVRSYPVEALSQESAGAELLVVGSRGRGGFAGLVLGSVSQGVLHHAHCPVAVIRGTQTQPDSNPGT